MIMWKERVWLFVNNRQKDLCDYRLSQAEDSLKAAKISYENALFKDSINRSYYACLPLEKIALYSGLTFEKVHELEKKLHTIDIGTLFLAVFCIKFFER